MNTSSLFICVRCSTACTCCAHAYASRARAVLHRSRHRPTGLHVRRKLVAGSRVRLSTQSRLGDSSTLRAHCRITVGDGTHGQRHARCARRHRSAWCSPARTCSTIRRAESSSPFRTASGLPRGSSSAIGRTIWRRSRFVDPTIEPLACRRERHRSRNADRLRLRAEWPIPLRRAATSPARPRRSVPRIRRS